jgi:CelD/BcsL family acetyltransferase involved in cellulose biosynthesis
VTEASCAVEHVVQTLVNNMKGHLAMYGIHWVRRWSGSVSSQPLSVHAISVSSQPLSVHAIRVSSQPLSVHAAIVCRLQKVLHCM